MRIYSSLVLGSGVKNSRLASTCSCCFTASRLWRHCLLLGLAMCILIAGHSLLNHVLSFDAKFLGNDGSGSDRSLLKMARTTLPATSRQRYDFHQGKPVPSNNQQTDEDVKEGIHGTKDNKRIVHSNQTQPDTFLEQERFQQRRVEKIQQVCRRQGIVRNPPVFVLMENASRPSYLEDSTNRSDADMYEETPTTFHFSLARSFQLMGCFINKVASSSLVSTFLSLSGLGSSFTSPHSLAFHLEPKSLEEFKFSNTTNFKFMFVRHPFDRMLSCYMDKMVKSPHFSLPAFRGYVKDKGREIIRKRKRLEARRKLDTKRGLPRPEMVKVGASSSLQPAKESEKSSSSSSNNHFVNGSLLSSSSNRTLSRRQVPTFEEFLEFVLSTDLQGSGYDAHWVPYHRYCTPCSINYHFIGKLETAFEDFQFLWNKTGLGVAKVPIPWVNKIEIPSKSKMELERRYYSSLPRELILRFYEAFRLDFEMFGYSIDDTLLKAGYQPLNNSVDVD